MNPVDAYLAYQAEIGGDEVVLSHPLPRPARPSQAPATPEKVPRPRAHFSLQPQTDTPENRERIPQSIPAPAAPSGPPPRAIEAPAFASLDAHWNFVLENHGQWFPGSGNPVRAQGEPRSLLAVVELAPSAPDRVFGGAPGELFDRMVKAIQLERGSLYLTSLMKSAPAGRAWARKDMARMLPLLFRELQLAAAPLVLLLGETCAQAVLRVGSGLDALRGTAREAEGFVFAASYHPAELNASAPEATHALKSKAWEDLKWLRTRLDLESPR